MIKKEIWKDVPGYENYYQVSNMGRVKSLDRWVTYSNGRKQFYKGKIMSGTLSNGYMWVTLSRDGLKNTSLKVSQLVAIAFLNHKRNGHLNVVDHINGDRSDDRLQNLRIVTSRANSSTCFKSNSEHFTSEYVGVSWNNRDSKWQAKIRYKDSQIGLGYFDDELKASISYQQALAKIKNCTFNPDDYKPKWTSKYKGVSFNKKSNKWTACIATKGKRKQKHLGTFKTELEAHHAYQKAIKLWKLVN